MGGGRERRSRCGRRRECSCSGHVDLITRHPRHAVHAQWSTAASPNCRTPATHTSPNCRTHKFQLPHTQVPTVAHTSLDCRTHKFQMLRMIADCWCDVRAGLTLSRTTLSVRAVARCWGQIWRNWRPRLPSYQVFGTRVREGVWGLGPGVWGCVGGGGM